MMLRMVLCTLLLALSSCTATKSVKPGYALNATSGQGLLATSLSYRGNYAGYSITFSSIENAKTHKIQIGEGLSLVPLSPKGDLSGYGRTGEVFAMELPKGKYRVYTWHVHSGYGHIAPLLPMNIEFEIVPGKVTYLGNFDFVQTDSLGLTVTAATVNYTDQAQIDIEVLLKKQPKIQRENILIGIAKDAKYFGIGGNTQTSWDIPMVLPVGG